MSIPKPLTARQMKKLVFAVTEAIPADLPSEFARKWIDNKRYLEETLRKILLNKNDDPEIAEINWKIVYEMLGMQTAYESAVTGLKIAKGISVWTVMVIKGLTCNKVLACLQKLGVDIKRYIKNPDTEVDHNDRHPNKGGSYAINFKRTIEADEENRNLSANDLNRRGAKGITLLERLLLELGYFISTGQHLDVESVTLCAGSRHKSGDIPRICFRSGSLMVYVCWCGSRDQCDHLRARSAWTGHSAKNEKNR